MRTSRSIRRLLNRLSTLDMLIDYSLHQRYGQTVMLAGVGRRPRVMSLGTAKAAAMDAERRAWWG